MYICKLKFAQVYDDIFVLRVLKEFVFAFDKKYNGLSCQH